VPRSKPLIATAAAILGVLLLATAGAGTASASSTARHNRACRSSAVRASRASRQRTRRRCRAAKGAKRNGASRRSHASSNLNRQRAASLARASAIASVIATPCQNTELTPEPADLELVRDAVFCLVNRVRAENGESPLILNAHLDAAAESHGAEMIADDYFEHISPTGETPVDRIRGTGYIPSPQVGYGTLSLATPQAIVEAWIASPKHLANILEGQYRETGIGVVPEVPAALSGGEPGATYSQEFGVIIP
jgi:uncharacterized protein YkwD